MHVIQFILLYRYIYRRLRGSKELSPLFPAGSGGDNVTEEISILGYTKARNKKGADEI
jgi:hypothetical protein